MKKLIVILIVICLVVWSVLLYIHIGNKSISNEINAYLEQTYPNEKFTLESVKFLLNGNIAEARFQDSHNLNFSVFYVNDKISDNFLRTRLESKIKESI